MLPSAPRRSYADDDTLIFECDALLAADFLTVVKERVRPRQAPEPLLVYRDQGSVAFGLLRCTDRSTTVMRDERSDNNDYSTDKCDLKTLHYSFPSLLARGSIRIPSSLSLTSLSTLVVGRHVCFASAPNAQEERGVTDLKRFS